jgi:ABC-type transport system involved in multi-copper enzyme maturation permease subunit
VRDYRVQLRGSRAVILWSVYLIVLIAFVMITYSNAVHQQIQSVVAAQRELQQFYNQVMSLMGVVIMLIAPALTATAVVAERQRKSLDLVFSAPVSPKYFLVGKMISSYRYVWMLLVLSLPITAACVVLGGATWSEVLVSYALLSIHALIYTSIAILFSTLAQKPVGAVVWSYIGVIAYCWIAFSVFALPAQVYSGLMFGRGSNEVPFCVGLNPFAIVQAAPTFTVIFGHHIPNWILTFVVALLFCRLMLLGAASVLSPYGSAETKSLRLHGLIYIFLFALGLAAAQAPTWMIMSSMSSSSGGFPGSAGPGPTSFGSDAEIYAGRTLLAMLMPLIIVLPFATCFGMDLEKKFWPDGAFSLRHMLKGTPSGALPYLFAIVLAGAAGIRTYAAIAGIAMGYRFVIVVFFALAFFFAAWAVGRLTSAMQSGLRQARTLHFTFLMLATVLPLPFLSLLDPTSYSSPEVTIWDVFLLRPLFSSGDKTDIALLHGTILLVIGLILTISSERIAKSRYAGMGLQYGRT